jgi:hypothetical protein
MWRSKITASIILLLSVGARAGDADEVRIRAETFFQNVSSRVVIQAAPNQTLVFDAQYGGDLILNGQDLVIYADKVEVIGTVTIRPYTADSAPSASSGVGAPGDPGGPGGESSPGGGGGQGQIGPTGQAGSRAGDIVLGIKSLTGTGKLVVAPIGQAGGRGGQGGRGGDAGRGGDGHNRDGCNMFCGNCNSPTNGGTGGRGGDGGPGGTGGAGGPGGVITYTDSLHAALDAGRLKFDLAPAAGGLGGPGGPPGNGGPGGGMGHGNACGGGGMNGGPGSGGGNGANGQPGSPGTPGKAICFGPACS